MRSLFHFPFPAQPPSQQPSPTATVSLQSEMCHRPHPAPMRRQRRSPVLLSAARPLPGPALTGSWPTVTRSQGARHAAPPSLPRAAARSHRAPSPEYRPAAARTHWARLVRIAPTACRRPHRIYPTACRHPHPPMSPPSRSRAHRPPSRPSCAAVLHVLRFAVRIAPTVRRRPRHPHLPPRVAAAPGPWLARTAPYASLFRVEEPEITHGAKMLPAPPGLSATAACGPAERALRHATATCGPTERALRHAAAACGTRHGRTGLAPCGAGLACLPHAPPAISPAFIAAVLHASRFAVRDPPRGPRTDASRYLRAAPIPPAARTHRVQETSGTTQTTQCGHKNRIPKWGPY